MHLRSFIPFCCLLVTAYCSAGQLPSQFGQWVAVTEYRAPQEMLVRWVSTAIKNNDETGGAWVLEIKADNTFSGEIDQGFGIVEDYTGTYKIEAYEILLKPASRKEPIRYRYEVSNGTLQLNQEKYSASFRTSTEPHPELAKLPRLPRTKQEAIAILLAKLPDEAKREIAGTRRDNLVKFHMGLGMYIRNGFGLWRGNGPLINDLTGGNPTHPDEMSGILIDALWDEIHKNDKVPSFDENTPTKYFAKIDAFLRNASQSKDTHALIYTPPWVLKDLNNAWSRWHAKQDPALLAEAHRIIGSKETLTYLALLYCGEHERKGAIYAQLEACLDDETLVPVPQRAFHNQENPILETTTYSWEPMPLSQMAALTLADLYCVFEFSTATGYREWKKKVEADPLLKWKYRPVISDTDLSELRSNPIEFARIVTQTLRWVHFETDGYEPLATEEGIELLERLENEIIPDKVLPNVQKQKELGARLVRKILGESPVSQLLKAIQLDPSKPQTDWHRGLETLHSAFFGAAILTVKENDLAKFPDKETVWNTLDLYRREAKISWPFKGYLCRRMFVVDFARTDGLTKQLFAPRPLPTDTKEVFHRTELLEVMIEDHLSHYRSLLKEIYFAGQEVKKREQAGVGYAATILQHLLRTGPQGKILYEEIKRDPRYRDD